MDSQNLCIIFINFEKRYEKLSDFTLLQIFYLTLPSDEELDNLVSKIPELQKGLWEIDENYPFSMPNLLIIIITILRTVFVIMLGEMIWYLKYDTAPGKVRHLLTIYSKKSKVPVPSISQYSQEDKCTVDISPPQLVSIRALLNSQYY